MSSDGGPGLASVAVVMQLTTFVFFCAQIKKKIRSYYEITKDNSLCMLSNNKST